MLLNVIMVLVLLVELFVAKKIIFAFKIIAK